MVVYWYFYCGAAQLQWNHRLTEISRRQFRLKAKCAHRLLFKRLLCKISTKHWESFQVHKLQFCSHFSTAGEWWGCSELHILFYWKYFHKTCFQSAWDDQPRSSDFSCKSNWMFCKIKTAPRFSFLPSQRSGMLAVQLLQTLLHMLFHSRLPD